MQKPDFRQNTQIQENSSTEIPTPHFYYKNVIGKTKNCWSWNQASKKRKRKTKKRQLKESRSIDNNKISFGQKISKKDKTTPLLCHFTIIVYSQCIHWSIFHI